MLNEKILEKRKFGTREMTIVGMLSGISIMLGITGWGFIKLPLIQATIMHVPVIIGAIMEGPIVGMLVGLIFGIFSVIQNLSAPSVLSFALINPLVSVLPRILIGITAYYSYKYLKLDSLIIRLMNIFLKNKKQDIKAIKIGVGAAIGSITNTVGVLGMIYIIYAAKFARAMKVSEAAAAKTIIGIALGNGVPEAIVAVIITVPIIIAVSKFRRR
ncbi:MAG: ECF transporter S component [Bacillota bacterium]|nr:ECF transporter S component [Bacillota bacterium]